MATYRRRQVLVDAPMQFGIGLHLVGWLYLYVVTFAVLCNGPALLDLIRADVGSPEYAEAILRIRAFGGFVVVPLVLTFIAMAAHGVYLTHRLAGPIYRLKMILADVRRGRVPETVRLRDKDYLQDLAQALEEACGRLRTDDVRTRELVAAARAEAQQISDAVRSGVEGHVGVVVDRLLDVCRTLDAHTAGSSAGDTPSIADQITAAASETESDGLADASAAGDEPAASEPVDASAGA